MQQLITAHQAAEIIGVSVHTIKAWMRRADYPLPSVQVGSTGSHLRVVASQINLWLEAEAARTEGTKK